MSLQTNQTNQHNHDEYIKTIIDRLMEKDKINFTDLLTIAIVAICFICGICDMIARS